MMILTNRKMMGNIANTPGGEPIDVPELYEHEIEMITGIKAVAAAGDDEALELASSDGITLNVINAGADKGFTMSPNGFTRHYHDFTPSFLKKTEEEPVEEPVDPTPGGGPSILA